MSGDRVVSQTGERLAEKLVDLYDQVATDDWPWFEDIATYNNAKLSHALILSGRWNDNPRITQIGVESLRWLCGKQLSPEGRFRPIGCNGFSRRDGPTAIHDQQAIEAHAMVSAAIAAYDVVKEPFWREQAHLAFDWFLGRNDLGSPIYNATTGGCYDGLAEHQVNENQGAESTLAFLLSLAEMQRLEVSLAAFKTAKANSATTPQPKETTTGAYAT
jgi:hypothetical protein